jgi:hypothetical protein
MAHLASVGETETWCIDKVRKQMTVEENQPESGGHPSVRPGPAIVKRRCVECGAFISRYNPSVEYCFNHDRPPFRFTWPTRPVLAHPASD